MAWRRASVKTSRYAGDASISHLCSLRTIRMKNPSIADRRAKRTAAMAADSPASVSIVSIRTAAPVWRWNCSSSWRAAAIAVTLNRPAVSRMSDELAWPNRRARSAVAWAWTWVAPRSRRIASSTRAALRIGNLRIRFSDCGNVVMGVAPVPWVAHAATVTPFQIPDSRFQILTSCLHLESGILAGFQILASCLHLESGILAGFQILASCLHLESGILAGFQILASCLHLESGILAGFQILASCLHLESGILAGFQILASCLHLESGILAGFQILASCLHLESGVLAGFQILASCLHLESGVLAGFQILASCLHLESGILAGFQILAS